jgi:hypothetical protein
VNAAAADSSLFSSRSPMHSMIRVRTRKERHLTLSKDAYGARAADDAERLDPLRSTRQRMGSIRTLNVVRRPMREARPAEYPSSRPSSRRNRIYPAPVCERSWSAYGGTRHMHTSSTAHVPSMGCMHSIAVAVGDLHSRSLVPRPKSDCDSRRTSHGNEVSRV